MGENNGCLNLFHELSRGEKQLRSKDWKFCKWRLAKSPLKMVKCTLFLGDAGLCGQTEAGFPSMGEWTGATETGVRGSAPITCRCFSYIICSQQRCPLICGTAVAGLGVQRYPCLQCLVLSPVFLSTGLGAGMPQDAIQVWASPWWQTQPHYRYLCWAPPSILHVHSWQSCSVLAG